MTVTRQTEKRIRTMMIKMTRAVIEVVVLAAVERAGIRAVMIGAVIAMIVVIVDTEGMTEGVVTAAAVIKARGVARTGGVEIAEEIVEDLHAAVVAVATVTVVMVVVTVVVVVAG